MEEQDNIRFNSVISFLPDAVKGTLSLLPATVKSKTEEIRIRTNLPLSLTVSGKPVFVRKDSLITLSPDDDAYKVSIDELKETYRKLIGSSVYSHLEEISNGFVTLKYGCRAGICGTGTESGNISNISSVNIRISREVPGAADPVKRGFRGFGILICGEPGSGKTTLLRDLILQLSSGSFGEYKKIAVIDTRSEISAASGGISYNRLGENTDILIGYPKEKGMDMALRTLSPDIIAFDEIKDMSELKKMEEGFGSGVDFITTAHIGEKSDIMKRPITAELIKSGIIKTVVFIENKVTKSVSVSGVNDFDY